MAKTEMKSINELYSEIVRLRSEITELKNAFVELRISITDGHINTTQFDEEVGFDNEPGYEDDEGLPRITEEAFGRLVDEGKVDFIYSKFRDLRQRWRVVKQYDLMYRGVQQRMWRFLDGEDFMGDNVMVFSTGTEAQDYADQLNAQRNEVEER